ncbi:MAG TPA: HAMP domain-containing sensor histidine kinase [Byssovorax sp.]|jgi:signal transduction histidine kinase
MTRHSWLLVIDPRGGVTVATPSAPQAWQEARTPADLDAEAPEIAAAMRAVAEEVRAGATRARRDVATATADVVVIALPAVVLHRSRVALAISIERALAPFRAQAEARDVLLRVDVAPGPPIEVEVDEPKIGWIVATLVGNALRFVRTGSRHVAGGTITVRLARAGDRVVVCVADDGPGIEAQHLAKLFDPERGVAVALALALDVAVAHGGSLDVTSDVSPDAHGTTVTLELPLAGRP